MVLHVLFITYSVLCLWTAYGICN